MHDPIIGCLVKYFFLRVMDTAQSLAWTTCTGPCGGWPSTRYAVNLEFKGMVHLIATKSYTWYNVPEQLSQQFMLQFQAIVTIGLVQERARQGGDLNTFSSTDIHAKVWDARYLIDGMDWMIIDNPQTFSSQRLDFSSAPSRSLQKLPFISSDI